MCIIAPDQSNTSVMESNCEVRYFVGTWSEHMASNSNGYWVHQRDHHQHRDISDFCGDCSC